MYLIHNTIRDPKNRTTRAKSPGTRGLKQHIMNGQRRLVTSRPVRISEDALLAHLEELKQKANQGLVRVTLMDGTPFNLDTLTAGHQASPPPLPKPLMDSISNDKPQGVPMSPFNGTPPPAEFEMPVEAPDAAFEDPILPALEAPSSDNSDSRKKNKRR